MTNRMDTNPQRVPDRRRALITHFNDLKCDQLGTSKSKEQHGVCFLDFLFASCIKIQNTGEASNPVMPINTDKYTQPNSNINLFSLAK